MIDVRGGRLRSFDVKFYVCVCWCVCTWQTVGETEGESRNIYFHFGLCVVLVTFISKVFELLALFEPPQTKPGFTADPSLSLLLCEHLMSFKLKVV